MKVIFLDMDGVMNPMNDWNPTRHEDIRRVAPRCAKRLNRVTAKTGAKLVISSAWRVGRSLEDLRTEFKAKGITGEIIGKTPRTWERRGIEIQHWLDEHAYLGIARFVIVDDDSDMEHLMPHLVKTKTGTGLTEAKAKELLERLTLDT